MLLVEKALTWWAGSVDSIECTSITIDRRISIPSYRYSSAIDRHVDDQRQVKPAIQIVHETGEMSVKTRLITVIESAKSPGIAVRICGDTIGRENR